MASIISGISLPSICEITPLGPCLRSALLPPAPPLLLGHPAAVAPFWEGNSIPEFPLQVASAFLLVCISDAFSQLQMNLQSSTFIDARCHPLTPLHANQSLARRHSSHPGKGHTVGFPSLVKT